jgi:orotidine-5'-phosphate decarboxylase
MKAPIILALDTSDIETAKAWVKATQESVSVYKLGLEFFLNFGADGVRAIQKECEAEIFLDLKLHDIPHTVAGAAKAISGLNPKFLTIHASGGRAMIKAAVDAVPHIDVTAVTILTSLSEDDLFEIGYANSALESAVALAVMAVNSGAKAIVCSPLEVAAIRSAVGPAPILITPGVRPLSDIGKDDQTRTMTPVSAISAGASYVVIGRPITGEWKNGAAAMSEKAHAIAIELSSAAK